MKCDNCTEKCPQEELACEIAKGRMYATNEVVRLQKELKEIKAIGTVEEFKALKEKSEPKKPRWLGHHFCPNCNSIVYVNGGKNIYCPKCGQALNWQ